MAPMSAFDQTLNEAPDVNRLVSRSWIVSPGEFLIRRLPVAIGQEDTFLLWKQICQSKLLVKVSLVLLLNKRDVLQRKLESGIRFGRYVKSYSGTNEWESVAKCELIDTVINGIPSRCSKTVCLLPFSFFVGRVDLKSKFKAVQRELSPVQRLFYGHITCATVHRLFLSKNHQPWYSL